MFKNQESDKEAAQGELFRKRKSDMTALERVTLLQEKLYCKAKQKRSYKFYILYDKMFVPYMLQEAYRKVKKNGGAPGTDGRTFDDIERDGAEKFLQELGEDLRKQTYQPSAVKRVWIPKANGGQRPLGIPTIRDRVAQMVCTMLIEPIFEADFEDSSYGFRPGRSAHDAMKAIKEHLQSGKTEVLDADLSKYFDTIPHDKLNIVLRQRIADSRIMKLINKWLRSTVYEDGQYRKSGDKGTPQGGVISPLLANIYMHLVDKTMNNPQGLFYQQGIKIVRYADDFVLMGRSMTATAIEKLKAILQRMELTLNETKTKIVNVRKEAFNFLGFSVKFMSDKYGRDKQYLHIQASAKSEKNVRANVRECLQKKGHYPPTDIAKSLNAIIQGWLNYIEIKGVSHPLMNKRKLRYYLLAKLNRFYNRKSQRRSNLYGTQAFEMLVSKHGLTDPTKYCAYATLRTPATNLCRKAVCGKTARTV